MGSKNPYQGRNALITGATSGFEYEFAKIFASNGFNLVLAARNDDKLREIAADFTQTYRVDVLTMLAEMHKKMKPGDEPQGGEISTHGHPREEREQINRTTGGTDGDYESHEDHIHTKD